MSAYSGHQHLPGTRESSSLDRKADSEETETTEKSKNNCLK